MWSPLVFCLFVGLVYSSSAPAWKDNTEYVYNIAGRTLASLDIGNEYSGILVKTQLTIQTRPDGKLQALLTKTQYAQIHSELSDGPLTHIPSAQVSWKPLEMSNKPFQIELKRGVITDIIVNKGTPNWEANIYKGIMSQFQIQILNPEQAYHEDRQDSALFKITEETVSGNTQTVYEVSPMPEHALINSEMVPAFEEMEEDDDKILEVVKHKNYTENSELPSYVFGLGNVEGRKAATNMMGEFFVRSTMTRALVTGSSKKFTIQNSVTINEISVSPTLSDRQQGSIMSMWNATLKKVKSQDQIMEDLASPIHLGGLVYSYNTPFSHSNEVSEKQKDQSGTDYKQDQPQINEAAEAPLLPFTIGNKGRSVKYGSEDIVKSVINLAREIGKDSQDPKKYLGSNTPSKFVILIKLVRIMNEEEIRKVSNELVPNNPHADNQDAIEYATWAVYRDAVAESGSPSALRVIESWIESKIIRKTEAAHVVAAMANSARYPTKEYLRLFFELIQKEVVKQQWPLNETATLSFAGFARQVYFDKSYYNTQFPRKSFNDLGEKAGERFVKDTVIPYFEESLNKAISQDKPNRIHMYIRALGHIGAPEILKAFEPYLEGKKQCSQFQRALMVISMDKLVKTFPDVARPVLFRLYSNNGEEQTVRVAAVYQLMRANPTPEMIQRMAAYTKVDVHEQVNAAVKTSIQHFANLDAEEFADMSHMTKMAEPLLTETDYGIHQGGNYLKNYFAEELQYKETIQLIGSSDYFAPKGIKYALRASEGGVKDQIVNAQALLTSIEQLTDVLSQQTQSYDDERKQQKQNAAEQQQHPFSSQNVARLLNMQLEAEEQLEGSAFVMDWNMAYKMFSFDNDTIRQLPSALEHWEKKLNGDNEIDYVKWTNTDDITIAFPTEMGIPFVFTYDNPMFYRVEGRVRMAADPKWAQNGKIQKPKTIKWNSDMRVTVGKKIQGHISFVTPFDHQQYYSGFDKLMQVHVPVVATAELDLKNNELTIEAEPENKKSNAPLFHYSTWPYTSRRDIMDFRSLVAQKHSQYIMPSQMRTIDVTVGKEQTGLAYQIKMEHDRATVKMSDMQVFYEKGIVDGLRNLWNDADIQYSQLNVTHLPRQSSTKKIQIRLGYDQDYSEEGEKASVSWNQISKANEPSERRELLLKKASADISNVKAHAVDISLRFKGDKNMDYVLSAACASSNVDPQSRAFAYLKQDTPRGKPYEIKLSSSMEVENSNALNMEDAFAADPKARAEIELEVESDDRDNAKVKAEIKASRSEKRKEYLKSRPLYYQCKHDMREGNNQSPACVNMTIRAPVMDKMEMDIKFDNVNPAVEDTIEMLYEHLKYEFYPRLSIDRKQRTESENKIKVQTFADPDFWYLNVTVKTSEQETSFKDIELDRYTKPLLALHPSIPVYDRVLSRVFEINTINPTCVVDQSQITTFNNWTYDASVSDKWTVLAQFLPKRANQWEQIFSAEKQLNAQRKNFVILVRESKESKKGKEVKVVLSTPRTDFKIIEINMTPKQSSKTKGSVTVNNQKIEVRDSESQDFADGFIQIFALPNGEIKMVVEDKFDLMYDGQRLRLEATTSMWRDSTRGLCGQANDQPNEDPLTPQNCYARDVDKFIKSFEIQGEEGQQVRQEFEEDSDECVERNMPLYVNAITKGETEVFDNSDESQSNECNRHQTRYVEQENEICFTTRVVPVCSRHCQAQGYITKTVSVHCIAKNNVALIWKKQIDNGSNPDFSHKKEHKKVQLEIPQSCSF